MERGNALDGRVEGRGEGKGKEVDGGDGALHVTKLLTGSLFFLPLDMTTLVSMRIVATLPSPTDLPQAVSAMRFPLPS